ncbi:MAG: hypothetical protein AAGA91_07680 [Pseudomonadota bacterium]
MTPPALFFVHVMKTAGTSLFWAMRNAVGVDYVRPRPSESPTAYFDIEELQQYDRERLAGARLVAGHFPCYLADEMPMPIEVATVLRHPVERTVSMLKQHRKEQADAATSLEEIYEIPEVFDSLIHNHQVKMFALTQGDGVANYMAPLTIDEARMDIARERLGSVHHLGLNEDLDAFFDRLCIRFGWTEKLPSMRVSAEAVPIDPGFRQRIERDNEADMAFFRYGSEIVRARADC